MGGNEAGNNNGSKRSQISPNKSTFMTEKKHYHMNVEDRQSMYRLKSAKIERKLEKESKMKLEEMQWKMMKRNQKIETVIQKKRMLEDEEQAKKLRKLDEYFEKTEKISYKKMVKGNSSKISLSYDEDET